MRQLRTSIFLPLLLSPTLSQCAVSRDLAASSPCESADEVQDSLPMGAAQRVRLPDLVHQAARVLGRTYVFNEVEYIACWGDSWFFLPDAEKLTREQYEAQLHAQLREHGILAAHFVKRGYWHLISMGSPGTCREIPRQEDEKQAILLGS